MANYESFEDSYLFGLIKSGNEQAFTELYNRYWQKLYFLAHKHLKSSTASEEIVQEVFLTIWKKRESLLIDSVEVYLAAMTRYAVYTSLALQKKQSGKTGNDLENKASTISLFDSIDNKLLIDDIFRLSAALPDKCRIVFIRNKLLDQPLDRVAEELNISPKTAEAHLTKALKFIRTKMGGASFFLFFL